MIPWTKKYEPKTSAEIIGQEEALYKLREAARLKKRIILYGPTGSGKTSAATAIGKDLNLELFEISASDTRNKEQIEKTLGNALTQQSLFSKGKLILIDDIDALSGTKDRGGLPTILGLIEKAHYPIILTCTNPWDDKYTKLRKPCILIEFQEIKKDPTLKHLKKIAKQENILFEEKTILELVKSAKGDLRAAITDLQTYSTRGKIYIDELTERKKNEDIHACLRKIFKSKKWNETLNIFDKSDEDLNECLLWLDENLPKEYTSEDLKKAYSYISRADIFNGRIRKWQHWRFLVYINILLTAGIAQAKKEANTNTIKYTRSTRILKLWQAKIKYAKKKSIAEKIAEKTHCSTKKALKNSFPYLKDLLKEKKISEELGLNEEEKEWLIRKS